MPPEDASSTTGVQPHGTVGMAETLSLSVTGVSKTFGLTEVLGDVTLDVRAGEIHALVGENGSGKSTFIKILAGYHQPDSETTGTLDGESFRVGHSVPDGLRFVHQDLGLVLELDAMDNLAMRGGFVRGFGRRVRWREQARRTTQVLDRLGVSIDIHRPLSEATPVERTMVAVAGALQGWHGGEGVLVLDEPTAVLPLEEVSRLFEMIRAISDTGTGVLYVSHRLEEIFDLADRVTVLRGGREVDTRPVAGLRANDLAELMVGDSVDAGYRTSVKIESDAPAILEVRNVHGRWLRGADLVVRRGEVLGIAGLSGAGTLELPYAIAGFAQDRVTGKVRMPLRSDDWLDIGDASRLGLPLVPADRSGEAVIREFSVQENLSLCVLDRFSGTWLRGRDESALLDEWTSRFSIKAPSKDAMISALSGGNQQKVILARCLARDPEVLILCEPTAGVDIATRVALYRIISDLAAKGLTVIIASSDENDLIGMCTRVVVLHSGRVARELTGTELVRSVIVSSVIEGDRHDNASS
jgi:ABC-type sugar transport system ATPase subunit